MPPAKKDTFAGWYKAWIEDAGERLNSSISNCMHSIQTAEVYEIELVKKRHKKLVRWGKRFKELTDDIKRVRRDIKLDKERLNTLQIRLQQQTTISDSEAQKVYKRLMGLAYINQIIVDGNELMIATKDIKVGRGKHEGKDFGRFTIKFGQHYYNHVSIHNETYMAGSSGLFGSNHIDHPHVRGGEPCFGDYHIDLERTWKARNLFLYIDTLINYLRLATNSDDAYMNMDSYMSEREKK